MWSEPVKLSEDHDFETIILDTEGLNSVRNYLNNSKFLNNRTRCNYRCQNIYSFTLIEFNFSL